MFPVSTKRRPAARVAIAMVMAVLVLPAIGSPARGAGPTCMGLEVTSEEFIGSWGPDIIMGTEGDDVIQAYGGNDTVYGGGGNDTICGGGGNDRLIGEDGDDILIGGAGHDWLTGGNGDDDLQGNRGNDRLYANLGIDVIRGGHGSDACGAETRFNCEMFKRWGHDPIDWLTEVQTHFGPLGEDLGVPDLVDEALQVMECESSGEPFAENPNSTASGLFQFLQGTWDRWNPRTPGWEGESVFHPEANIATAARLVRASVDEGQNRWWQWSCKPS